MAGVAAAEVLATRTRTNDFVVNVGAAVLVPLNNAGSTTTPFVTTVENQRVVIEYTAECTVTAAGTATWVSLTIQVDGVTALPTSTDQAFCTSNNNGSNWASVVSRAIFVVPDAGIHTARILVQLNNAVAGNTARLDDSTTTVAQ
jgi:hypothetical protein